MRITFLVPVSTAALLAFGCAVSSSTTSTPDSQPTASDPSAGKPVADATAQTPEPTPAPTPDPKAAENEQVKKALADLDANQKKEAERWTPELKEKVAKLTSTKWGSTNTAMKSILASDHRKPENKERDEFRHPKETLAAFGIKPTMHVFEVGPGAGWWTEILAPLLATGGKLKIAGYDTKSSEPRVTLMARRIEGMLSVAPELYGKVELVPNKPGSYEFGPADSLDAVFVTRMMHNIIRSNALQAFLTESAEALKPGGILAIEQHRAAPDADVTQSVEKGYVPEKWLIEQVEAAGFKLEKKSEVNANKADTKDHAQGVWSLPPTLAEGEKDKAKYESIGESDRMTLKFVKLKPKKPAATAGKTDKVTAPAAPATKETAPAPDPAAAAKPATTPAPTK